MPSKSDHGKSKSSDFFKFIENTSQLFQSGFLKLLHWKAYSMLKDVRDVFLAHFINFTVTMKSHEWFMGIKQWLANVLQWKFPPSHLVKSVQADRDTWNTFFQYTTFDQGSVNFNKMFLVRQLPFNFALVDFRLGTISRLEMVGFTFWANSLILWLLSVEVTLKVLSSSL